MKISISYRQTASNVYRAEEQKGSPAAGRDKKASGSGRADSVELSDSAQLMQKALEMVGDADATPRKRLEELREEVRNNTYQVPVEQLADLLRSQLL